MNPGPVDSVEHVATGFIEAMKQQPLALALAVCNILLLAIFFYVAYISSTNRANEFNALQQTQREVQKLLFQCAPAPGAPMKLQSDESHPFLFQMPQPRPQEAPHGDDDRAIQQRSDQSHSDDSRPE